MTGQCRADGLIDPDAIPGANIKPEQVDAAGNAFATAGTDVQTRGAEVKTAWAGLGGSYTTPDSAELLTVMDGVETDTAALAGTMQKVSTAISDYATVVAPIARRLVELKTEAETFVAKALQGKTVGPWDPEHPANQGPVGLVQHFGEILDDVHLRWDEYTPYVDENNELLTKVAEQETKLSQASADCVNAINGLRTDMCIAQVQAVDYTTAVKANEPMPWGSTGRGDQSCQESFDSGVGDAAVGTVEGLGGLIGYNSQTGEWGDGEWAGQSWLGFAESLGALALMGSPPLILAATLPPGVLPDVVRETAQGITAKQQAIVEGFVGSPEDWRDDPAHAAGGAAFNIGTLFIPGAGEIGAGAKVAAVGSRVAAMAADGSRLAAFGSKIAAAGTTMVRVGDALSAIPGRALDGLGDLVSRGRGSFADALRGLGDNIPTVRVSVEHAMATPDGFGVGLGRPHIEVGHPEPGSHWLHSVADSVDGGGGADHGPHGEHSNSHAHEVLDEAGAEPTPNADTARAVIADSNRFSELEVRVDGEVVDVADRSLSSAFDRFGGIEAVDGRWNTAHTVDRHLWGEEPGVLQSDTEIMARSPMPIAGHGAFRLTIDDLDRVLGRALDANKQSVDSWLAGTDKVKVIRASFQAPIGRHYLHGLVDTDQVTVVLRRDISAPQGFFIKTAYPSI